MNLQDVDALKYEWNDELSAWVHVDDLLNKRPGGIIRADFSKPPPEWAKVVINKQKESRWSDCGEN